MFELFRGRILEVNEFRREGVEVNKDAARGNARSKRVVPGGKCSSCTTGRVPE